MALARLASTALDCDDPARLADFWAALTDNGWLAMVKVDGHTPPTWPESSVPKQMHLDLKVRDLEAAEAEAVRLGATVAAEQPAPDRWRVLHDPAGHPFCLSTQIPD